MCNTGKCKYEDNNLDCTCIGGDFPDDTLCKLLDRALLAKRENDITKKELQNGKRTKD